jgi:hypothetical protein
MAMQYTLPPNPHGHCSVLQSFDTRTLYKFFLLRWSFGESEVPAGRNAFKTNSVRPNGFLSRFTVYAVEITRSDSLECVRWWVCRVRLP